MVSNPVTNHIIKIQAAEPTSRAIAAVTKNIPDPIMDPATKLVASTRPKERFNSCFVSKLFDLNFI
jgi:hypothetical protein